LKELMYKPRLSDSWRARNS